VSTDEGREDPGVQEVHNVVCDPRRPRARLAGGVDPGGTRIQLHVRLTLSVRGLQRQSVFVDELQLRQRQMEGTVY
jgi:hypothetical protein